MNRESLGIAAIDRLGNRPPAVFYGFPACNHTQNAIDGLIVRQTQGKGWVFRPLIGLGINVQRHRSTLFERPGPDGTATSSNRTSQSGRANSCQ
ncbi:MAG: hypothetical protein IT364_19240 [Candidatus Hydrogenedentes bacterium]|nr:hypothetical protein [Candidatus Hydrogenedentota bacterium]